MRVLVLLAAVGCSFPEKHRAGGDGGGGNDSSGQDGTGIDGVTGDGGSGPFGCLGLPFPTNAPPTIAFQGTVQLSNGQPFFPQFPIQGLDANGNQFFSAFTDSTGNWSAANVPTNGVAINGHIHINADPTVGFLATDYYPRRPFDSNQTNLALTVYDQNTMQQLYSSVGRSYNANQATLLLELTDCNGTPIAGAKLIMQPPPQQGIYYMRNNVPDATIGMTDSTGVVIALGVNPTNTQLTGTNAMNQPLHSYTILFAPSSVTIALVQP